jgi:phosphatidylserine/phosphatidylglycerophosphate/cardiolipin synthase-like enzyme
MKYALLCLILAGCIAQIPEENGTIEAFFCDKTDCTQLFAQKTASAHSVACAMYNSNKAFLNELKQKNGLLVTDEEHPVSGAVSEKGNGLMHNKFCVAEDFVWTGSWNPSQEMTIPNNVVLIHSRTLAQAYQAEFDELSDGTFHGGSSHPGRVKFNGQLLESYFCPEDDCQKHVLDVLKTAQKSIHFMAYSFTDDKIGSLLSDKKHNLDVKGVFDPRKNEYSEYEKLKDVSTIAKVHHKVFIIDSNTVITGSYNPSRNANEKNDENIVIIRDPQIAQQFEKEFARFI